LGTSPALLLIHFDPSFEAFNGGPGDTAGPMRDQ